MPDAAPVPLRFRQLPGDHVCGTPRVPRLAQVLGDDGRAANVDQERPAEVELALLGRPDRKRLAEAELRILTRVAGLGVPERRGVRRRRQRSPGARAGVCAFGCPSSEASIPSETPPGVGPSQQAVSLQVGRVLPVTVSDFGGRA
jgi:hypothetical protein